MTQFSIQHQPRVRRGGRRNDSPYPNPGRGQYKSRFKANGCRKKGRYADTLYITVMFDAETFAQVRARAIQEGVSFAEMNRRLVEWGLEA